MNITVLEITPFGFVMRLNHDSPYFSPMEYKLILNDMEIGRYRHNVISVYGLRPNTVYQGMVVGEGIAETFVIQTEDPTYVIDVRDYNAYGDGIADDTAAINAAIYSAPSGSVVYIPEGVYLVNQILLRSGVDLYLSKGAVIRQNVLRSSLAVLKGFQQNYHHSDFTMNASWEGNPLDSYGSLLYGQEVDHIRIYGEGTIDGNGDKGDWWTNPKSKDIAYRPRNITLNRCRKISVMSITSRNSASWNTHPMYCEQVRFLNMSLISASHSPNTDGINPESCVGVEIIGCHLDVGDDCIAIKSGKYFMSQHRLQACEDILIENCFMGDGHGGVAIGSEISGGVRNVMIRQCYMLGTDRGIRVKTRRGRGKDSIVENIHVSDITMDQVLHGITVNMFYCCDPDGKTLYVRDKTVTEKDDYTPEVKNIRMEQINAKRLRGCAIFLYGLPESPIDGVEIRDCSFTFVESREETDHRFSFDQTIEPPEMLEDFVYDSNLGLHILNATNVSMRNNQYTGKYNTVTDMQ